MQANPSRVLFLCTGNYYRSRFAEVLFNTLAAENGLNWTAFSRGLATERGIHNVGPISPHARRGLAARGLSVEEPIRFPLQLQPRDLAQADVVIALKEAEHRPLVEARFPRWASRVVYWHVDDVEQASPQESLAEMEGQVRRLVERLAKEGAAPRERQGDDL